jgi:hypothetical protein
MFSLRAEGFSCSLGVLYEGLGISKWQLLIKKIEIKFPAINFFNFRSSNPGSGPGIRTRDPDPGSGPGIRARDPDPGSGPGIQTRDPDPGSGPGIQIRNPDPQREKMLDPHPYPDSH